MLTTTFVFVSLHREQAQPTTAFPLDTLQKMARRLRFLVFREWRLFVSGSLDQIEEVALAPLVL